jgi:hypothetical protein
VCRSLLPSFITQRFVTVYQEINQILRKLKNYYLDPAPASSLLPLLEFFSNAKPIGWIAGDKRYDEWVKVLKKNCQLVLDSIQGHAEFAVNQNCNFTEGLKAREILREFLAFPEPFGDQAEQLLQNLKSNEKNKIEGLEDEFSAKLGKIFGDQEAPDLLVRLT